MFMSVLVFVSSRIVSCHAEYVGITRVCVFLPLYYTYNGAVDLNGLSAGKVRTSQNLRVVDGS